MNIPLDKYQSTLFCLIKLLPHKIQEQILTELQENIMKHAEAAGLVWVNE